MSWHFDRNIQLCHAYNLWNAESESGLWPGGCAAITAILSTPQSENSLIHMYSDVYVIWHVLYKSMIHTVWCVSVLCWNIKFHCGHWAELKQNSNINHFVYSAYFNNTTFASLTFKTLFFYFFNIFIFQNIFWIIYIENTVFCLVVVCFIIVFVCLSSTM